MASVGSSHSRLTSAEDNEEASLLGCPPIGLLDGEEFRTRQPSNQEGLIRPLAGLDDTRFVAPAKKLGGDCSAGSDRLPLGHNGFDVGFVFLGLVWHPPIQ